MRDRISLPTVNWLDFPPGGDPRPLHPLVDVLRGIAASGCSGVGLDDCSVRVFLRDGRGVDAVQAMLEHVGLRCTDVGILRVGTPGAIELADELGRLAAATGAHTCVTALYAPATPAVLTELSACADALQRAGARLAIEFAPYGSLRTLADTVSVCEHVGWERCGVLLDIWHFVHSGQPWDVLCALRADQLAFVHLADAPETGSGDLQHDSRFRRVPPGTASFPTARLLGTLEDLGYNGVVSVEVLSAELRAQAPEIGARRLFEAVRAAWPAARPDPIE